MAHSSPEIFGIITKHIQTSAKHEAFDFEVFDLFSNLVLEWPDMPITNSKISFIPKLLYSLDLNSCKLIADWLNNHIKILEIEHWVYDKNLQHVGLSVRTFNVLKKNEIYTIQELIKTSANWDNIKKLKGVGPFVEAEIKKKVIEYTKDLNNYKKDITVKQIQMFRSK